MTEEQPRFFLDRGVGSQQLPAFLRGLGWRLTTMNERYGSATGQRLADADWIRDAAERGEAILCKDKAIAKNPLEAEAVWFSSAKVFAIASARITGEQMIQRVGAHQLTIIRWARKTPGPFVAGIYESGLRRLDLRTP
ncbi:hypothetical protein [uncultured Amnibacterium sp.]|uniref:PIN-like domain-containing protein n=1 Tax=uncultured Amnibacterium sp. TaxID=1631851 RepID=UPI0035CA285A